MNEQLQQAKAVLTQLSKALELKRRLVEATMNEATAHAEWVDCSRPIPIEEIANYQRAIIHKATAEVDLMMVEIEGIEANINHLQSQVKQAESSLILPIFGPPNGQRQ